METMCKQDIARDFPFVDGEEDLLNFSLDVDEIEDSNTKSTNLSKDSSSFCSSNGSGGCGGGGGFSLPADEEEELEWISNKDAFPAIEFDILDDKPDIGVLGQQHSPVSVLESVIVSRNGNVRSSSITDNRTGHGTLQVPIGFPNDVRKKRVGRKPRIGFEQHKYLFLARQVVNVVDVQETPGRPVKVGKNRASSFGRRCSHCDSDKTPQWRTGPMGNKTLCNACGVRYKSGRLVPEYRPANSPTFSTVLHSNSHRKIVEMRRQKEEGIWQPMGKETF